MKKDKKRNIIAWLKLISLAAILLVGTALSIYLKYRGISMQSLEHIGSYWYSVAIYIFLYALMTFLPLLPMPLVLAGSFIFPFLEVWIYSLIGGLIFSLISFYLAKLLGRDYIESREAENRKTRLLFESIRKKNLSRSIMLRLCFIIPPEMINIVSGLSGIKLKEFVIAYFISNIPLLFFSILLIKSIIYGNSAFFIISAVILALMIIIPLFALSGLQNYLGIKIMNRRK